MALPIDQLTKPLTKEQVEQSIYNLLPNDFPIKSFKTGSVVRTIISVVATVFSGFTSIMADLVKAEFLDLAEGFWLTLLAYYVYRVTRIPDGFATGTVTLTNTGGGLFTFDPGELILLNTTKKKNYKNTAAFTLNPLETKDIDVIALEAGTASSAGIDEIDAFVTTLLGVTCSNDAVLIGADEEKDEDLRIRCRNALGALSPNGPQDAYNYFAKSTVRPDGSTIIVNRTKISQDSSTGLVQVYLADPDGPLDTADVNLIDANIQSKCVPISVICIVDNAVPVNMVLTINVFFKLKVNVSVQSLTDIITGPNGALATVFGNYPIGGQPLIPGDQGYLWFDQIENALLNADPSIFRVDLDITSANTIIDFNGSKAVELADNEIATYTIPFGNLTITPV